MRGKGVPDFGCVVAFVFVLLLLLEGSASRFVRVVSFCLFYAVCVFGSFLFSVFLFREILIELSSRLSVLASSRPQAFYRFSILIVGGRTTGQADNRLQGTRVVGRRSGETDSRAISETGGRSGQKQEHSNKSTGRNRNFG